MLIGLASKSAILIVEFANQQMRQGANVVQAALRAALTRLRPILMTSIAFVIAVTPLVFAIGRGQCRAPLAGNRRLRRNARLDVPESRDHAGALRHH